MNLIKFIFAGLCVFFIISCNESDIPVFYSKNSVVVTGIVFTFETSPEDYGVWGSPSNNNGDNKTLRISNAYPNPTIVSLSISYQILKNSQVKIWVVPAVLSSTIDANYSQRTTALFTQPDLYFIKPLLDDFLKVGYYSSTWNAKDSEGNDLPGGFYRIYIKAGDVLGWQDILLYRSSDDLPADLKYFYRRPW
ncbi:MAG: hypothetical protein C4539_02365 [Ignavibacteriales bacterium]|nr:MAG: hypothetical protein C4539_02365 [Ignavibacteriales bacterium]